MWSQRVGYDCRGSNECSLLWWVIKEDFPLWLARVYVAEARVSGGSYAGRPGWWLRPCQGLSVTLAHFVPNQSDGSGEDADKERQGRSCVVCPASCFRSSVAEDGRTGVGSHLRPGVMEVGESPGRSGNWPGDTEGLRWGVSPPAPAGSSYPAVEGSLVQ